MAKTRSAYVELLLSRYEGNISRNERDDLIGLSEAPEEEGLEGAMLEFLQENPEASLQDAMQFFWSIRNLEALKIVGDNELDEDDFAGEKTNDR